MKYLSIVIAVLFSTPSLASFCFVPIMPIQGSPSYMWQSYHRDVEQYNRCIHRELQELQRQQQQQQQQNSNLFNSW